MNLDMSVKELLNEGYELVSPAQKEARKKYQDRQSKKDGRQFVMQKVENYSLVTSQLGQGEKGVLLFLTTAMSMNNEGKLFKDSENRLTVSDVAEMIGKKRTATHKVLSELEAYGLITKEQVGKEVFVNISEGFYSCGELQSKVPFVKIFKKQLQAVAKELSLNEMGFLSDLLAHMHYETHLLCSNPTEKDTSQLELWRGKDVIELLGYSKSFVGATLRKFRQLKITIEIRTVRDVILLHPNLASRQYKKVTLEEIVEVIDSSHLSSKNYRKSN
ncbi:winged helix-turn-helix domain-containing protein [Bacillus hominis]|uniref:helix-turn-helix transcriptional regulator n=1 Tax=Bacillus hominis TaxID=2817478 RepID=UPI0025A17C12|nr:winged helix-turn-helix domain-containing protein [Bacillus hominis]MDM5432354.1 winged helix-turn-helix domain-containing protein [Bacillus hominis]